MFVAANEFRSGEANAEVLPFPSYGRFMQPDPLGYADDANPYAYVGNGPVNLVDPTGTKFVWRTITACVGYANNCGPTGYWAWEPDAFLGFGLGRSGSTGGGGDGGGGGDAGGSTPTEPTPQPTPQQCPLLPNLLPHGTAIVGNLNVSGGVGAGAIFDETIGLGLFGRNFGGFVSGVAGSLGAARGPSLTNPRQTTGGPPTAAGAYAGISGGILVTNATNVSQLRGPFDTSTFNFPFGSISISHGGRIWSVAVTAGPGAIGSTSRATTNTKTIGGC